MHHDPRLLQSFVVLAETLHFGRAAQHLHVTQPTLSQRIHRLERQLGVTLLERSSRRVTLSEAGAAVLEQARVAVAASRAVDALAAEHRGGYRGELRLGFSPGVHYLAQRVLTDLDPRVRVSARQENTGVLCELVARGELEVALGFSPAPRPGVVVEELAEEPALVAVRTDHPLARRDTVALSDLAAETFALVDAADGPGYNAAVRERCRAAGFEPRTPANPHGPLAWETAVRSGGCVGLTTRSAAAGTARGVRLVPLRPRVTFPVALLHARTVGPAARAFAEAARARARRVKLRAHEEG
jgi:DNA-binding transcriptional LysR family regulator